MNSYCLILLCAIILSACGSTAENVDPVKVTIAELREIKTELRQMRSEQLDMKTDISAALAREKNHERGISFTKFGPLFDLSELEEPHDEVIQFTELENFDPIQVGHLSDGQWKWFKISLGDQSNSTFLSVTLTKNAVSAHMRMRSEVSDEDYFECNAWDVTNAMADTEPEVCVYQAAPGTYLSGDYLLVVMATEDFGGNKATLEAMWGNWGLQDEMSCVDFPDGISHSLTFSLFMTSYAKSVEVSVPFFWVSESNEILDQSDVKLSVSRKYYPNEMLSCSVLGTPYTENSCGVSEDPCTGIVECLFDIRPLGGDIHRLFPPEWYSIAIDLPKQKNGEIVKAFPRVVVTDNHIPPSAKAPKNKSPPPSPSDSFASPTSLQLWLSVGGAVLGTMVCVALYIFFIHKRRSRRPALGTDLLAPAGYLHIPKDDENKIGIVPYRFLKDVEKLSSDEFTTSWKATLLQQDGDISVVCKMAAALPGRTVKEWPEYSLLKYLPFHPHCLQLLGICPNWPAELSKGSLLPAIVVPYFSGMLATKYLNLAKDRLEKSTLLNFAKQMTQAVQFLHLNKVIHRDIILDHFSVARSQSKGLKVVLTDFSLAQNTDEACVAFLKPLLQRQLASHWRWAPPERLDIITNATKASDIWSLGVAFWQLVRPSEVPFERCSNATELSEFMKKRMSDRNGSVPLDFRGDFPEELQDLIEMCCRYQVEQRPAAHVIYQKIIARL